ncbi:MAG: alpha-glucan family phosphorylase [Tumebacillaceae bacterium]
MDARIAYFSAEFGLDPRLPIYSGGLGVLAGDHVKAANDLSVSLVGVGIFYRRGYFQQRLHEDGTQEALYPKMNPDDLPVTLVRDEHDEPLCIGVPIAKRTVYLHVWCAQVGSVPVYLMDADHDANRETDRRLTDSLYGGDQETRIAHEIILGIGGVRVLRALGLQPDVWHMNEGHVAFLTLERIREYSAEGFSFDTALEAVKASTVFTTHTPVPAGHDEFSFELLGRYFCDYYWQLGVGLEKILSLGRAGDKFNMTRLALRTSSSVNGVSQLHAAVTRDLFHRWTPDIPPQDVPVAAVTNGIHTATWLAPELKELYENQLCASWSERVSDQFLWDGIAGIPEEQVWAAHQGAKRRMIGRLSFADLENTLTVGFARRFATYKRANLLFRDLDRLDRIVNHPERPVCFVFSGKAHPADGPGQNLIRRIAEVSQMERFRGRIYLVENYDMEIASHLVQGVDVWLNTPQKPMEASGTSGQKAGVNGVLNCSVLDGWWAEGYNGGNGWAIEGATHGTRDDKDSVDGDELYRLLEEEIAPLYYQRGECKYSPGWVAMMKESIRSITPRFSTARMVGEYRDRLYEPAAERGQRFAANQLEIAGRVGAYKRFIRNHWHQVYIRSIDLLPHLENAGWSTLQATVQLGPIWHDDVRVEAVGSDGHGGVWKMAMLLAEQPEKGQYLYKGTFLGTMSDWQRANANVRVLPVSAEFANDFELEVTAWGTQWR